MPDDWMIQRGLVASTLRPLREEDATAALIDAVRAVYGVAPTPHPTSGAGPLFTSRDAQGRFVLQCGLDPAEARAIVGRLAIAWRAPLRWASTVVEFVEGRKPPCAFSMTDGGFDRDGRPCAASPSVDDPEIDAERLDTDRPWAVRDQVIDHVYECWNLDSKVDSVHWDVTPPPLPEEPRLAAVVRGLRAARTSAVTPDGDRLRVEVVPWAGGREVWFLRLDEAARLGLGAE